MSSKNINIRFDDFSIECNYEDTIRSDGDALIDTLLRKLNEWTNSQGFLSCSNKVVLITRQNVESMFRIRIDNLYENDFLSLKNSVHLKNESIPHQVEIYILTDGKIFFNQNSKMVAGTNRAAQYRYISNAQPCYAVGKWNGDPPQTFKENPSSPNKTIKFEPIAFLDTTASLAVEQINSLKIDDVPYVYPSNADQYLNLNQLTVLLGNPKLTTFETNVYTRKLDDDEFLLIDNFDPKNPLHLLSAFKKDSVFTCPIDQYRFQYEIAMNNLAIIRRKLKICADYLNDTFSQDDSVLIDELDLSLAMMKSDNDLRACVHDVQALLKKREYIEDSKSKSYSKADKSQLYLIKYVIYQAPSGNNQGRLKAQIQEMRSMGFFQFSADFNYNGQAMVQPKAKTYG